MADTPPPAPASSAVPSAAAPNADSSLSGTAKSVILMEATSGKVLYENNADEHLPIASVTKIMTMLLAMEALDNGVMTLDTQLTCSANAASMGGSQVYLEPGETMSFNDTMKAIAVSSGNDAAVMMAEAIGGTEGEFVKMMNDKAAQLGMVNTHFINPNGLDEGTEAYSSARDVALMSAELLKHPKIEDYLTIWMDTLRNGAFTLSNTNKLIHSYQGANGIKTGSTAEAGYCLSASAERDGMDLIAVVLGAPSTADRFSIATGLLDYGFANYATIDIGTSDSFGKVAVEKGDTSSIEVQPARTGSVVVPKAKKSQVQAEIDLPKKVAAPIKQGDKIGSVSYKLGDETLDTIDLVSTEDVERMNFWQSLFNNFKKIF